MLSLWRFMIGDDNMGGRPSWIQIEEGKLKVHFHGGQRHSVRNRLENGFSFRTIWHFQRRDARISPTFPVRYWLQQQDWTRLMA